MPLKSFTTYSISFFQKALTWPLTFMPATLQVPIMSGLLRGQRWIVGAGNHSHWLGIYEYKKQKIFIKTIQSKSVVYDIGGHAGFFAMLASAVVGSGGHVYVFEPLPRNLVFLRNHIRLNKIKNIDVIACAVSKNCGTRRFKEASNSYMGRLSHKGHLKVKVVAIDELYENRSIRPPDCIKIDVEGEEYSVLKGAKVVLAKYHPIIFMDAHGNRVHAKCSTFLESLGYEISAIKINNLDESYEIMARPQRIGN